MKPTICHDFKILEVIEKQVIFLLTFRRKRKSKDKMCCELWDVNMKLEVQKIIGTKIELNKTDVKKNSI